jgi:hypothetical protein
MDMRRLVVFDAPITEELHVLLAEAGARPHSVYPLAWVTPSPAGFTTIEAALRRLDISFEVSYEAHPAPGDKHLAGYLGLDDFAGMDAAADDLVLACDERTLATVVSTAMKDLLTPVSTGVTFDDLMGHDGFFVITVTASLPDPVVVPRAMFMSEGYDGAWAVQSDGRELLTETNLRVVQEHGVVSAPECVVDGRVLRWERPLVFSGRVLRELRDKDVRGWCSRRSRGRRGYGPCRARGRRVRVGLGEGRQGGWFSRR